MSTWRACQPIADEPAPLSVDHPRTARSAAAAFGRAWLAQLGHRGGVTARARTAPRLSCCRARPRESSAIYVRQERRPANWVRSDVEQRPDGDMSAHPTVEDRWAAHERSELTVCSPRSATTAPGFADPRALKAYAGSAP